MTDVVQRSRARKPRARGLRKEARRLLQEHHAADGHHPLSKQCLKTEQDTGSLCGAVFDAVIMPTEHDVVERMTEQTRLYNEGVQAAGKGHALGPPQIWAWGGLITGLQKQGAAVGAANAATLTGHWKQLDGMSMDMKCDHARFCRVDRTYQSEQHALGRIQS